MLIAICSLNSVENNAFLQKLMLFASKTCQKRPVGEATNTYFYLELPFVLQIFLFQIVFFPPFALVFGSTLSIFWLSFNRRGWLLCGSLWHQFSIPPFTCGGKTGKDLATKIACCEKKIIEGSLLFFLHSPTSSLSVVSTQTSFYFPIHNTSSTPHCDDYFIHQLVWRSRVKTMTGRFKCGKNENIRLSSII